MLHRITVLPQKLNIRAEAGRNLLEVLREAGLSLNAPCGGSGTCGKCKVLIDGHAQLACHTTVDRDMTVTLPEAGAFQILTDADALIPGGENGYTLAFDIGTTTVVGNLLDRKTGAPLSCLGTPNPQRTYGADVVSRIRHGIQGHSNALTGSIRECLEQLTQQLCRDAGVPSEEIRLVSLVGNPAMQQFTLGLPVDNLAKVPFAPILTAMEQIPAGKVLKLWENAELLIVPDIAGFVGADTVACILAADMDRLHEMTLLVDIGTNGEMVLGNREKMIACSAAAGPALEGAGIRFGMGGRDGAIDHVYLEGGTLQCTVIGGGKAEGICGSGLIDAVAAALDAGWLNARGKILTGDGLIHLTEDIFLDQEDIRQVQLAKGAIAAGIQLMADAMSISFSEVNAVYLAGAFGCYMDPRSACRIGLLPKELEDKITAIGNAARQGANILACSLEGEKRVERILARTEALELSTLPGFPRCFAKNMRFADGNMD